MRGIKVIVRELSFLSHFVVYFSPHLSFVNHTGYSSLSSFAAADCDFGDNCSLYSGSEIGNCWLSIKR